MTLSDLERPDGRNHVLFHTVRQLLGFRSNLHQIHWS